MTEEHVHMRSRCAVHIHTGVNRSLLKWITLLLPAEGTHRLGRCGSITRSTASTAIGDINDVCWLMTLLLSDLQVKHVQQQTQTKQQKTEGQYPHS
jgi:hypothetical protein